MGNKDTVLEYTEKLGMQGKRLDASLLSDHRRRVIMMYIQESIDAMGADQLASSKKNVKPTPRAKMKM